MTAIELTSTSYSGLRDTELFVAGEVNIVEITDCPNLTRVVLPETVISFTAAGCPQLASVELPNRLSCLILKHCPQLPALALPTDLAELYLSHCTALTLDSLPVKIEELTVRECPNVSMSGLPLLQNLYKVDLSGCGDVPELPAEVREVKLRGCTNVAALQLGDYLRKLTLEECPDITQLNVPPQVKTFRLFKCRALEMVTINTDSQFGGSPRYYIGDCPALTEIRLPRGLGRTFEMEGKPR